MELTVLEGMREKEKSPPYDGPSSNLSDWAPGMKTAIVLALERWSFRPALRPMTKKQWRDHIARNHLPFRRDCSICVTSGGTGRRHGKIEHPSQFTLSADVAGPLKRPGLDSNSRGVSAKPFKYLLAGTFRFPDTFLNDFSKGKGDPQKSWPNDPGGVPQGTEESTPAKSSKPPEVSESQGTRGEEPSSSARAPTSGDEVQDVLVELFGEEEKHEVEDVPVTAESQANEVGDSDLVEYEPDYVDVPDEGAEPAVDETGLWYAPAQVRQLSSCDPAA